MSATQTITQRHAANANNKSNQPAVPNTYRGVVRVPSEKPSFTVGDIRRAIPAHCFSRPLSKSFGYLFGDMAVVALLYYGSTWIGELSDARFGAGVAPLLRHVLWSLYWIAQGCVMTGLWVIGHECGHRGFADSTLINDVVGLVVHSCLLVPYFAWQISHRRHHSNTGSVEHDEVFVPALATKQQIEAHKQSEANRAAGHDDDEHASLVQQTASAVHRMFFIVVMLTLGWPAYLAANLSGNQSYLPGTWVNHFAPSSPIFKASADLSVDTEADKHNRMLIVISDVALLTVFAALYKWVQLTSLAHVVYVFFIPYLIVNFWLVLITYLQHTDTALPHYTSGEWDWLRGALATVDRDYGIINIILHHITDTHVVHHLFSQMPHYHAQEATDAVKQLLGPYYRFDSTPIHKALWNSFRDCQVIYPDSKNNNIHWFEH